MIKEALYYEKIDKDNVQCKLCPHNCKIECAKLLKEKVVDEKNCISN